MQHQIEIIEDGYRVIFGTDRLSQFRESGLIEHPSGEIAKKYGQSPITMRVYFKDTNTVKLRGDKNTPYINNMLSNLTALLKKYITEGKVHRAVMYDNRPDAFKKVILEWNSEAYRKKHNIDHPEATKENLLPLYNDYHKLKPSKNTA